MKVLSMDHAIRCTEPEFWKAFLDPEYTTRLFREVLAFPEFEIVHQEESETEIVRRCVAQPALGSGQKLMLDLFGKPFRFTEEGRFDKQARTWKWRLEASLFTEAMQNEGTVRVETIDDQTIKRRTEITLAANVPVVGLDDGGASRAAAARRLGQVRRLHERRLVGRRARLKRQAVASHAAIVQRT